jgi:hypothetical protein
VEINTQAVSPEFIGGILPPWKTKIPEGIVTSGGFAAGRYFIRVIFTHPLG